MRRHQLVCLVCLTLLVGAPIVPARGQAALDWSAGDSASVAWLAEHGRRVEGRGVIVWVPRDSLTEPLQRALVDSLDRGVAELRRAMGGVRPWQRIGARPVTFYLSPGRYVSHATVQGAVFIRWELVRTGRAPFLHEASHVLLFPAPPAGSAPGAPATRAARLDEQPLWLMEGLPDVMAQRAAQAVGFGEGDTFNVGGLDRAHATCAERTAASPFGDEILAKVGTRGRLPQLFTTERQTVAPAFYACAQSAALELVERIGLERAAGIVAGVLDGSWEHRFGEAAASSIADFNAGWARRIRELRGMREPGGERE